MKEILLMKRKIKNKLLKKILLIVAFCYVAVILINQQQTISSYNTQHKFYMDKIKEAKEYNQTLEQEKEHLNSKEYIEKIAREKLNMYAENERVYIDINK